MSIADNYRRQFHRRGWGAVFDALPRLEEQTVFDLGCGPGDMAAELVARGAHVVGVDVNEEFIRACRSRRLSNARFRVADIRELQDLGEPADGIWCSFGAAYLPDLSAAMPTWTRCLKPGGWMALTEIDDLFGHEPVGDRTRELLGAYVDESLAVGRYDFRMGHKLKAHLQQAGLEVTAELMLEDREHAFDGPAEPEVVEAWRTRFERMKLLRDFCGREIDQVQRDFLSCLEWRKGSSLGLTLHSALPYRTTRATDIERSSSARSGGTPLLAARQGVFGVRGRSVRPRLDPLGTKAARCT